MILVFSHCIFFESDQSHFHDVLLISPPHLARCMDHHLSNDKIANG
jgi:hypothetical protein